MQQRQVEERISEEQTVLAKLQVRKQRLEQRRSQTEDEAQQVLVVEELRQVDCELEAARETVETLETQADFVEAKLAQIDAELLQFSPDDVEQLRFDQVQSIEGARACLGAFFGILLDVNVYKTELEARSAQQEATIESLLGQVEEIRKIQQANEVSFQQELQQLGLEYQQKEELMKRLILENGGPEFEQLLTKLLAGPLPRT